VLSANFVIISDFIIISSEPVLLVIFLTNGACSHLTLVSSFIQSRPRIHIPLDHWSRKENGAFRFFTFEMVASGDSFDGYSSEIRFSPSN